MGKIYVETRNGLIVGEALTTTARLLVSLEGGADIDFTSDETGPHFVVPENIMATFLDQIDTEPAPKKRRTRKKVEPSEPETDSDTTPEVEPDTDTELEDPDIQE
jgi:hypothetical protein